IARDLQQVAIYLERAARVYPAPVRDQGALLYADPRQQHVELRGAHRERRIGLLESPVVDVAIAQQREQRADLDLAGVVRVVGALVERKGAVREPVVGVHARSERAEIAFDAALRDRAVVEA